VIWRLLLLIYRSGWFQEEKERTVFKDSFPIGKEEERKRLELASKKAACLLLLLVQDSYRIR
jgi:hypothetical protein